MESSAKRGRNWATIVYPDSATYNKHWQENLADLHLSAFVIFHDKDNQPDSKDRKKPHYHVLLMFDGNKSFNQIAEIFALIDGVGCIRVENLRSHSRYLCHLDDPSKFQYPVSDVVQIGGSNYMEVISSCADDIKALRDMLDFINDNNIYSFYKFNQICSSEHPDWFYLCATRYHNFIYQHIKSLGYTAKINN